MSLFSVVRIFIVAFRSAKERQNATFAERKATLICRKMLRSPSTQRDSREGRLRLTARSPETHPTSANPK